VGIMALSPPKSRQGADERSVEPCTLSEQNKNEWLTKKIAPPAQAV
jgi:hypothetical protein